MLKCWVLFYFIFFVKGSGIILTLNEIYHQITYEKLWNKKRTIVYLDSSIVFFLRGFLDEHSVVAVLMLNPMINHKTLDMA